MKTKVITSQNFEVQLNNFWNENPTIEVVDIKFTSIITLSNIQVHTAFITYNDCYVSEGTSIHSVCK